MHTIDPEVSEALCTRVFVVAVAALKAPPLLRSFISPLDLPPTGLMPALRGALHSASGSLHAEGNNPPYTLAYKNLVRKGCGKKIISLIFCRKG